MADKHSGIIDPPIDELLSKVDSKYQLVIFASKRARQINDYYADLHEGSLFDNVGPLVDSTIDDKPLSVALHEINEDKSRAQATELRVNSALVTALNVVVGITGGIAAYKAVRVVRALVARRPRCSRRRDGGRAAFRRATDARGDQPQPGALRPLRRRR